MSLIILERDGVINALSSQGIRSADDWQPLPGSIEALASLAKAGFTLVIATQQSGLADDSLDLDNLEAIHAKLTQAVEEAGGNIAAIFYCPHGAGDACNCRKPKTGLIDAIEAVFDHTASEAPFIDHSLEGLLAADSKDCDPILVRTGLGVSTAAALGQHASLQYIPIFADLAAASHHILSTYTLD